MFYIMKVFICNYNYLFEIVKIILKKIILLIQLIIIIILNTKYRLHPDGSSRDSKILFFVNILLLFCITAKFTVNLFNFILGKDY